MSDATGASVVHTAEAHLKPAPDLRRWSVRVGRAERPALENLLGVSLPTEPLRAFHSGEGAALWLGPDEWLVLMPPDRAAAFCHRCAQFNWAAAPPCSVVEITHRNVGLVLTGTWIPWILNAGCPLDLSSSAFPPGTCTRTLFHKAEIVLWRQSSPVFRYHVECWRSYSPYLWKHLAQSAAECAAQHA